LRAIENRAYALRNPPARVQFQPTEVGLARRCARIAFAVAYPAFTLKKLGVTQLGLFHREDTKSAKKNKKNLRVRLPSSEGCLFAVQLRNA
jgi:hypothetical protein